MENHDTRRRFDISTTDYPIMLLFKKGDNQNAIKYAGDFQEESLITWFEEQTDIFIGR